VSFLGASLTTTTTARADEPPKARVVIEGTKPDVEVSLQTGSAFGAGSNGSTIAITSWKNVCVAPCAFDLPQGRQTLLFRREGSPSTTHSAIFRPGETRLTVKPGLVIPYTIGYTLVLLGLTAALAGGSLWAAGALSPSGDGGKKSGVASTGKYFALGGAVGMAGGIALVLTTGTDVEEKAPDAPRAFRPQPPTTASRALGLSYGRAF
jgi:hypothetical protein